MRTLLVVSGVFALAALAWTVQIVRVSSNSMAGTYCDGEVLIAVRHSSSQDLRDQVVVFRRPGQGLVIKRVVAVGGDSVQMNDGLSIVNGKPQKEPYVGCRERLRAIDSWWSHVGESQATLSRVPAEALWVLGDNRLVSIDSRDLGPISRRDVRSVVALSLFRPRSKHCTCG